MGATAITYINVVTQSEIKYIYGGLNYIQVFYFIHLFLFSCSLKMNFEPTAKNSSPQTEDQDVTNSISTLLLFDNSIFNDALSPLKVHLEKENAKQNVLDRWLESGLQIVQRKDREMHQVAPTLQLLLQHGAKWKDGALLEDQMTPYHLICQSTGDYHELLDWLLKSSDQTLINTKDGYGSTALCHAVRNANINCVRTLIANGADVNIAGLRWCASTFIRFLSPIVLAIERLQRASKESTSIITGIFDLLLDNGAHIHKSKTLDKSYIPIHYAIEVGNVECVIKIIEKGAKLNACDYDINDFWGNAARLGSVKLVKCLLNHGIDKDSTDQYGRSFLSNVVSSGDVEAVRYLLNLGVRVTSNTPKVKLEPCQKCGTNRLSQESDSHREEEDPFIASVSRDEPEIVQMLVEHGSQSCQSFIALIIAVKGCCVGVVEYLLNKYSYPLNIEHSTNVFLGRSYYTLLTVPCQKNAIKITKMLLDHGADPNKRICEEKNSSILLEAIHYKREEAIALYIRNRVDINFRSFDKKHGMVLPFEASVLRDRLYVTEMLLVSGCSYGMFSLENNLEIKDNREFDLKDLMKKWKVDENNVKPLQQQCRRMILNHLSPQADKKIMKMPLPPIIINYLSIPELDDILTACRNSTRMNRYKVFY